MFEKESITYVYMSKRLIFTQISPPTDFFTYNVVGANVGAVTTSNRAALKRRANNTASGQPCCDKPEASSSENEMLLVDGLVRPVFSDSSERI